MIDLNQMVQVTWCPANREHYEKLGYKYERRGKFFVKASELLPQSEKQVIAVCDYGGETVNVKWCNYMKSTKNFTEKYCCSRCKGLKAYEKRYDPSIYYQRYVDSCIEKGYEPLSSISDFKGTEKSLLKIRCQRHGEQTTNYCYAVGGQVCIECSKEKYPIWNKKTQEEVCGIIEGKNDNKWINTDEYIDVNSPNLVIRCGTCGEPFITSLVAIMNGGGRCKECGDAYSGQIQRLDTNEVKMRIEASGENKLLNPEDYVSNSTQNLMVTCPCGNKYITSLVRYENGRTRCDECVHGKSSGEYLVEEILNKHNIEFDPEHYFEDCRDQRYLPFDFYLPLYNSCIEFDGQGHYEPIFGEEAFESTVKHDAMKNEYCKTHGINLLRIPFWEFENAELMISNFLGLTKFPQIIRYHKNPYTEKLPNII